MRGAQQESIVSVYGLEPESSRKAGGTKEGLGRKGYDVPERVKGKGPEIESAGSGLIEEKTGKEKYYLLPWGSDQRWFAKD